LASGRDVGVGHHALRPDGMAAQNVATKSLPPLYLRLAKVAIVDIVARIVNLDADRAGIEVSLAGPQALPGMPGALGLPHHLGAANIRGDEIGARALRPLLREPVERGVRGVHAGVVQHEHVYHAVVSPRLSVRRRTPQRGERTVGTCGHVLLFIMLRSGRKAASRSIRPHPETVASRGRLRMRVGREPAKSES